MSERFLKWAASLFALLILPLMFTGCYAGSKYETSGGTAAGTVRKFSHTGLLYRTYELTINAGTEQVPLWHHYTVEGPDPRLKPGNRVVLTYRKFLTTWGPNGETNFRITNVEVLR